MEAFSVRTSRFVLSLLSVFVVLGLASPVYAQEAAAAGAALGQGKAVASAAEAIARNPGAAGEIRGALILGLVLIESLALYTLVITFIAKG